MKRSVPWMVFSAFLIYVAAAIFRPVPAPGGYRMAEFGALPVLMSGRVLPMDSVARIGLLQIRGTADVPLENAGLSNGRSLDATEWLLEVLVKPGAADQRKIFPIGDATVLRMLGLPQAAGPGAGYYAFKDLEPKLGEIGTQTARIAKITSSARARWEQEWVKVRNTLMIYERLKNSLQPNSFLERGAGGTAIAYDFAAQVAEYQSHLRVRAKAAVAKEPGQESTIDAKTDKAMRAFARPYLGMSRVAMFAVVPPADLTKTRDHWENMGTIVINSARTGHLPEPVARFAGMSSAFVLGKPDVFNREVASYQQWLRTKGLEPEARRSRSEFFYHRFQPYVRAAAIYLVACLLLGAYWFTRSSALYRSAAMLMVLACVLHATGLLFEMMIEGRPPVTNRFASIVLGGLAMVLIGGAAERHWRNTIGATVAALSGLVFLVVAHGLRTNGGVVLMGAMLDAWLGLAVAAMVLAFWFARADAHVPVGFGTEAAPRVRVRDRLARPVPPRAFGMIQAPDQAPTVIDPS